MSYLQTEYSGVAASRFPQALRQFLESIGVQAGHSVVDVGSGTGDFLWPWREASVAAVDRENGLRPAYRSKVAFYQWNFVSPLSDTHRGGASLVLCKSVIEHQRDPVAFVQSIALWGDEGSTVVLMAPDFETCWRDFYDDPTHVSPMTLKGLKQCVRLAGFTVSKSGKFTQTPFLVLHPRLAAVLRVLMPGGLALWLYRQFGWDWPRRASQAACYVVFSA